MHWSRKKEIDFQVGIVLPKARVAKNDANKNIPKGVKDNVQGRRMGQDFQLFFEQVAISWIFSEKFLCIGRISFRICQYLDFQKKKKKSSQIFFLHEKSWKNQKSKISENLERYPTYEKRIQFLGKFCNATMKQEQDLNKNLSKWFD